MRILTRIAQVVLLLAVASSFAHADNFMYFKKKAVAAAGGGGVSVTDDFNRGNANPIGGNWTTAGAYNAVQIADNAAKGTNASANSCAYWNAAVFNNDQYSQAVIGVVGGVSGVVVRAISSTFYRLQRADASVWRLYKVVAGTATQLGLDFSVSSTTGDTIKLSASGTTLTVALNGLDQGTRTDNVIASGAPGIYAYGTTVTLDNWAGGDL